MSAKPAAKTAPPAAASLTSDQAGHLQRGAAFFCSMSPDEDDLTPDQQGKIPPHDTLARRARRERLGRGRLGRPRSWITILVGLLTLAVCLFILARMS